MYISRAGLGLLYYQRRKFMCFAVVKRLPILTLESCIKSLLFSRKENGCFDRSRRDAIAR